VRPAPTTVTEAIDMLKAMGVEPNTTCTGCRARVFVVTYSVGRDRISECAACSHVFAVGPATDEAAIIGPELP